MAAQASRPASGQNVDPRPAILPPRNTPLSGGLDGVNSSLIGAGPLEMVELSSKSIIEGILGPNKDGRVRNPVPSKLKGKTDTKKGNFGVMHMAGVKNHEVLGKDAAAERDAAARRTSENTASRAKAAQQEKYIPPKKRGLEATLNEASRNTNRGSPFARDDKRQARPLAPDETKSEQARLLTLLRSINPVTVVDQICKAVAYFGGIPGAPPPEDGIFPESANTRETGALFIGWLAEIFPNVTAPSPEIMKAPEMGKKKSRPSIGHQVSSSNAAAPTPDEEPNSRNGYGYGPAISAPAWGLPTNLAEANPQAPNVPDRPMQTETNNGGPEKQPDQQFAPNTPVQPGATEAQNNAASASNKRRGRGRPKGSTNKKMKGDAQGDYNGVATGDTNGGNASTEGQANQAQEMAGAALHASGQDQNQSGFHPAINNQAAPKSAQLQQFPDQSWQNHPQKNNMQSANMVPDELSPEERAVLEAFRVHGTEGMNAVNPVGALPSPVVSTKGPAEGGVKRKRVPAKPKVTPIPPPKPITGSMSYATQASPQVQQQQLQTQPQQAPQQLKQIPQQTQQVQSMQQVQQSPLQTAENGALSNANNELVMNIAKDSMQWASSVDNTPKQASAATAPPPPKRQRQRKPKAPAAPAVEPPSRTQTASVVSVPTPKIPPSTIPDSQGTSSQQSIQQSVPVTRPPAEGLEAHYERFASLSQQQNGRSNTPTVSQPQQQQQQHVRQHSKTTTLPPQQTTPTIPQQMQQQKSQGVQQNTQRSDSKVSQDATTRAPSNYYGQRSQSTSSYNQQYPSHQTSQLYNTQSSSPQLSNANSNNYRTNSSHTLANSSHTLANSSHTLANSSHTLAQNTMSQNSMAAQASPQFSAAETYRTASPHIAQPSPSFAQTESNYRTTNAHNLAQPSPAFTQAENPYRTPATHSMAQGTSSYSTARSHAQAPSTHYNQFSDSSYMDLPTLESLGHSGSGTTASLGGYGQGMSVGMGGGNNTTNNQSRSTGSTSGLYSTANSTGLSGYDTSAADLLRVSRGTGGSGHNTHSAYGRSGGSLGNAFDTEHEMREQLLRGMGRR
ncbi:hypothetical protein GLAREA_02791 [Glarea lozoyensis ATCC 20868]|uniref:Uncharacterized protein n=1 Tax=Glarea lozoyensis (strain ATCC 20868 / MF5171) TaxID=1116229 RepID=S3CK48_GLAL2|nr:uncharacterized protein GLAREA_02791 [Glarea lozoyensis ATCC 20868]EPE26877.1 hypothetical protein GLAREA_02791 [Glarea lozoyensis ATCC 20868]